MHALKSTPIRLAHFLKIVINNFFPVTLITQKFLFQFFLHHILQFKERRDVVEILEKSKVKFPLFHFMRSVILKILKI